MKTTPIFVGVIAFALTLQTQAQSVIDSLKVQQLEEVFLSDSKTNLQSQYSGKIVKKITQKQLEPMQGLNLTNIIDRIVGIELSGSKSLTGQNISYKVRGGRSKDVVVLVDGVVVSDPSYLKILLIPITAGGISKKLLFSSYENVVAVPAMVVVAVVVTIPTALSLTPLALPRFISSSVILYFRYV